MSNGDDLSLNSPGKYAPVPKFRQAVVDGILIPLGYQQLTSISAATALTVPTNARIALIQTETQNVRWRDDGTNPTSSVGMLLRTTVDLWYTGSLSALKVIEAASGAVVNVSYYR